MTDRNMGDIAALGAAVSSQLSWLPTAITMAAGILAIVWTSIRIYEWARVRICGKDGDITL